MSYPRPFEFESKTDYIKRCLRMPNAGLSAFKRLSVIEAAWEKAKGECQVSITTHIDQFLLF